MASLLSLPNELLYDITDVIERDHPRDLANLRQTCRLLWGMATKPFAVINFTNRYHTFSEHSLKALVETTSHAIFGPHIKSVSFSGVCRRLGPDVKLPEQASDADTRICCLDDGRLCRPALLKLLEQAFANIRIHSRLVSVGVFDANLFYHGLQQLIRRPQTELVYSPGEVLNHISLATESTGCQVRCANVSVPATHIAQSGSVKRALTDLKIRGMRTSYRTNMVSY